MRTHSPASTQRGFSLMEVLITMLIMLIALLGIAALQSRALIAELESQQRAQALIAMSDIVDRMNVNRSTVSCFAFTDNLANGTPYVGADGANRLGTPACVASTTAYNSAAVTAIEDIDDLLQGSSETVGSTRVGGMIGARSCITYDATTELPNAAGTGVIPGTGRYTVIVTWQGMAELFAPPPSLNCAVGLYGNETQRRAVSTTLRIADLL